MTIDSDARITNLENRVLALEKTLQTESSCSGLKKRGPSINEFLREKGPTTAVDRILAIAVFSGVDSFNVQDLRELIRKAREKKPKNVNDLINKNISKGYMAEEDDSGDDGKMRWYVTQLGYDFVDSNFERNE